MKQQTKRTLIWTPRVLGMLFAAFVSLFALDVFAEGVPIGEAILGLLVHLIPVYVLAIGVWLGWRWEWVGAATFGAFALWFIVISWGNFNLITLLIMAGIPLLIALFYLFDWSYRSELQSELRSETGTV